MLSARTRIMTRLVGVALDRQGRAGMDLERQPLRLGQRPHQGGALIGEQLLQYRGCELAAAAAAVGETGQTHYWHIHGFISL